MRRSLLLWGLGHVTLGDRRGWLLAAVEVVAIAGLVALADTVGRGERAYLLFAALVAFFAVWALQAVAAYREAVRRGATPAGAISIVGLAPAAVVVFTAFWLVAGSAATPAATLQRYVAAWRDGRPADAAPLLAEGESPDAVAERWRRDDAYLRLRLLELSRTLGGSSGLDPDAPFAPLFVSVGPIAVDESGTRRADAALSIVRRVTVHERLFGIFPTASRRDVVVEPIGTVRLVAVPHGGPLPLRSDVWLIEASAIGSGTSAGGRPAWGGTVGSLSGLLTTTLSTF